MEKITDHLQIGMLLHGIFFHDNTHDRQDHGNTQGLQHCPDQHQKNKKHHFVLLLLIQ